MPLDRRVFTRRLIGAGAPAFAALARARRDATPTASHTGPAGTVPSTKVYRGDPTHAGHQPGPFPAGVPGIRWTFGTSAPLTLSPLLHPGTGIVVTGGAEGQVFALHAGTGHLAWATTIAAELRSTGTIAGDTVVVPSGSLHGFAIADGAPVPLAPDAENSITSPLTVLDGVVFSGGVRWGGGFLDARDLATGEQRWRFDLPVGIAGAPVASGDLVIGATIGTEIVAVEHATGVARWRVPTRGGVYATPSAGDGLLFVPTYVDLTYQSATEGLNAHLNAIDLASGSLVWQAVLAIPADAAPALVAGLVVVPGDRWLHAFVAATGEERWRYAAPGAMVASPVVCDGHILAGTQDGTLIALDLDGTELWRLELGEPINGSPAVLDGVVYVLAGHSLHALAVG